MKDESGVLWQARWIWDSGEENPWNYYLCARRTFEVPAGADLSGARLHITADTRYLLWLDGERVGYGPVRAWPQHYRYDTYELAERLKPGRNTLAVLVLHYGVGTFQSLPTRAGLLAQLEWDGRTQVATDSSWRVRAHPGYRRAAPRISCQQGWVELFDASPDCWGWEQPEYDDSGWERATEVGTVGIEPWTELQPREVPFLTEEAVLPAAVLEVRRVLPPDSPWSINLRGNLLPGYLDSNAMPICGLLAALMVNSRRVVRRASIRAPGPPHNAASRLRVNGQDVEAVKRAAPPWDGGWTWSFDLQPGENLLLWDVSGCFFEWAINFVMEGSTRGYAPLQGASRITYGPFDSPDYPVFQAIWNAASRAELEPYAEYARPVGLSEQVANPFLSVAYAEPLPGAPAVESEPGKWVNGCTAGDTGAVAIHPDPEDAVTELLLDFGRMTVGWWELDLEAEEGTYITLLGFESMQDGARDLPWGVNNALRYRCREGRQTYRSVVRRGCRYLAVSVRPAENAAEPVRIHSVRTVLSTYPVEERGAFECSDPLLNRIWQMGAYTTRLCMEDTYVDCPTYEQTFWVGDARNAGAVNHYAFGAYDLSRRSLLLAAESMERSPVVESQVPSAWKETLITWSLLWVLACEEYWQLTGDLDFVEQVYPAVAGQAQALAEHVGDDGLLRYPGYHLMDWAPMDNPPGAAVTHGNAWYVETLRRQAVLARVVGCEQDARRAEELSHRIIAAMNALLWDNRRKAYRDCLHGDGRHSEVFSEQTQIAALLCLCAPPERDAIVASYIGKPQEWMLRVGSPFTLFFAFEALARLGRYEEILAITRERWGFMLERGATTCWETFPGWEPDGRWTRSHCHAWSTGPTYFLSRYQLGVAPLEPGFTPALIAPQPAGLSWARGRVPTPHGEIHVSWRDEAKMFLLEAALPPGVSALVRAPIPAEPGRLELVGECERAGTAEHPEVRVSPGAAVTLRIRR